MKTEINLSAEPRDMKVSITALRKKGLMPAIYYGRNKTATPVVVPAVEFSKILARTGESTVVTLTTAEGPLDSLIYDIDRDPVTDTPRHADFYVFEKGQKMKVKIPLEFIGIAPVVKDLGAVLVKVLHELHVEAAPKDLPHTLAVDLAKLVNFESQILASDIALPDGVTLVEHPTEVVASVYEPKEEAVPAEPVDLSTIEVEKKGKEAKEGEEGADAVSPKAEEDKNAGKSEKK